jgi:hypothetical protein
LIFFFYQCRKSHDEKALAAFPHRREQDALQLLVVLGVRQHQQVEAGVRGGQAPLPTYRNFENKTKASVVFRHKKRTQSRVQRL